MAEMRFEMKNSAEKNAKVDKSYDYIHTLSVTFFTFYFLVKRI
jgi:hypothetical protein